MAKAMTKETTMTLIATFWAASEVCLEAESMAAYGNLDRMAEELVCDLAMALEVDSFDLMPEIDALIERIKRDLF